MPYFYEQDITPSTQNLSEATSRHCVQVLRMKEGEQLQLTNGKGDLFTATIIHADKKNCAITITGTNYNQPAANNISVAISLLKNPTRFEWFLEKAAEIGIKEIFPLVCERTEKENFRFDRMNNILISAMLQSKQSRLPLLYQPTKLNVLTDKNFDGLKLIAHCEEKEKQFIGHTINPNKNMLILIGPEGDFSPAEIENAIRRNFIPVSLGNTRLRAETAGIVAAAILNSINMRS